MAVVELPSNIDMGNISKIIDKYKNYDISQAEYKTIVAPESGNSNFFLKFKRVILSQRDWTFYYNR